ncbi:unnamed protein product [Paramecium pentaurelia]|uniref:Amino acid transporter transmembrane domain-containing protein n=1 Tax=Paramecium pentaurelia TaxID=43138 RepID=A0A8S1WRH0_9CILI|nr:unnamed protein product [Paramecium pentaurelia]
MLDEKQYNAGIQSQNIGSNEFGSNNILDEKQLGPAPQIEINLEYKPITLDQIQQQKVAPKKQSSYKGATLTLFKTFVGSGILALPYSFAKGGYVLSTIVFVLLSLLINYQQVNFIMMADKYRQPNQLMDYSKFIEITLGARYRSFSKLIVGSMQWGCCISYVIFFMEFFEIAFYGNDTSTFQHQLYYLLIALLILLPMTLIQNMAVFTKVSAIANGLIVFPLVMIIVSAIQAIINESYPKKYHLIDFSGLSTMIGVSIYSFEAVGVLLNIQSSMQKKEKFQRLLQLTTIAVVLLFIIFSLVCGFGYGIDINQIVLFNLQDNPFMAVVQISYAIGLLLSFPVQLLPAFQILEGNEKVNSYIYKSQDSANRKRIIIRMVQVVLLSLIAMFIPQFAVFLSLVGGFSGSALQFYFPLVIYKKNFYDSQPVRQRTTYCCLMIIGIIVGSFAAINSLILLIKG